MLVRANEVMPKRDRTALIETYDVERVLANIDADDGDCGVELLGHGVLLVFGAPCQRNLREGQEHGRPSHYRALGRVPWFANFRKFWAALRA